MSTVGRNQLCPCGSGKKYKKCCLKKDQEAKGKATAIPPLASLFREGKSALNPRMKYKETPADVLYTKLEEANDTEEKINLFLEHLEDEEAMTADNAFEYLNQIHAELSGEDPVESHQRFHDLISIFRKKQPDLYEESIVYYLSSLIENAIRLEKWDEVDKYVRELVLHAGSDIDMVKSPMGALYYHNQKELLREVTPIMLKSLRNNDGHFDWVADEIEEEAVFLLVAQQFEDGGSSEDSAFLDRLQSIAPDFKKEFVQTSMSYLHDPNQREWNLPEFALHSYAVEDDLSWDERQEQAEETNWFETPQGLLVLLSFGFMGYAYREEGLPLTRLEFIRPQLLEYLRRKANNDIREVTNVFAPRPKRSKGKGRSRSKAKSSSFKHPLCPDQTTLDRYLGEIRYEGFDPSVYKGAAFLECLPSWLRFLTTVGLLPSEALSKAMDEIQPLASPMLKLVRNDKASPTAEKNLVNIFVKEGWLEEGET